MHPTNLEPSTTFDHGLAKGDSRVGVGLDSVSFVCIHPPDVGLRRVFAYELCWRRRGGHRLSFKGVCDEWGPAHPCRCPAQP